MFADFLSFSRSTTFYRIFGLIGDWFNRRIPLEKGTVLNKVTINVHRVAFKVAEWKLLAKEIASVMIL